MSVFSIARPTGRSLRGAEAWLITFAVVIAVGAYLAVEDGVHQQLSASVIWYAGALAILVVAAHLVVRRVAPYADPVLLPVATVLNGLGLVMIHRLDLANNETSRQFGHHVTHGDAGLQLAWTAFAIVCFIGVLLLVRDHRVLGRYTYTWAVVGLGLLLLPAVLPARFSEVNGARVWIRLGGFSFQPSEIAKIALIIFFAAYLVAKRDLLALASRRIAGMDLPRGRDLGPILFAWVISVAVLVRENDLGTSLLFFGFFLAMLYVATERWSWLAIGVSLFAVGAWLSNLIFGHVHQRVADWLHPFQYFNAKGGSYQLVEGLFGMASGGIFGTGLGQGRPDLVPFAKTDFIVATIGEELGLAGLMAILAIYAYLVTRGIRTALSVRDGFGKLLAGGLSFVIALQVFVVVGGVTRLIPLTGLTLPFVSYGGSSLVSNWVLVALLLRVSDAARRPSEPTRPSPRDVTTEVIRP